jgi:hypothetical protein
MEPLPLNREAVHGIDAKLTDVRLDKAGEAFVVPVALRPVHRWAEKDPRETFHVTTAGCAEEADLYAALYGMGAPRLPWRTTPKFEVDSPDGGTLVIEVGEIGGGDQVLSVTVDGASVLRKDLRGGRREVNDAAERYARIAIQPGKHEVVVANDGGDWIIVGSYVFLFEVRDADASPPVRVLGQQGADFAFAWLQNIYADPATRVAGVETRVIEGATLRIASLKPGKYRVTWWDTKAGKAISETIAKSADGRLALPLPGSLADDVAVKVSRAD